MVRSGKFVLMIGMVTAVSLFVLAYVVVVQLGWTAGQMGAPLDDAWIHMQYGRNISNGDGFSYNIGDSTAGSTAPLWTLLLTIPALLTPSWLLHGALLLSALFMVATGWITSFITYRWTARYWLAGVAGVTTICVGRFAYAGWSGMEATAFAAVSMAAVYAFTQYGFRFWVGILFGLASQLRPEGHALLLLAAVVWIISTRGAWRQAIRPTVWAAVGYLLVSLPYVLFSLQTTGKPLPNTFYAKASTAATLFSWRTLHETIIYHWQDNWVSLCLLPCGLIALHQTGKRWLWGLWLIGLPLFTAIVVDAVWHHGRYTLPLIPFQIVLAALGIDWLYKRFQRRFILWLTAVLLPIASVIGLPYWAEMVGKNTREINDIDVAMGHWLREHTPADALIAVDDIGAIGYLSERRIFDLNGLISPEMWPTMRDVPEGLPRNQATTRLLADIRPDYLAIFPAWHYELANTPTVAIPIATFNTDTHTIIFGQEAGIYHFQSPYFPDKALDDDVAIDALFDDHIRLRGYEVRGDKLLIDWESITAVSQSYALFVHFLDMDGNIVAQIDGKPADGLIGTEAWQAGDMIRDEHLLPLPQELWHVVVAGLYLPETGERLPVSGTNRGKTGDQAILFK